MAEAVPDAVRATFARHNRRALFLGVLTIVFLVAFWGVVYFFLYAATLVFLTATRGVEAQMPPHFAQLFATSAVLFLVLGLVAHQLNPRPVVRDHKSALEIVGEFLLAIPRATLAAWGNFRAYQFLDEHEMALAWQLLQKIEREKRVSLHHVPVEIADSRLREKVLIALQLVELIDFRKSDNELWLVLRDDKARALCQPRIRFHA